jgi:hypothetical protein
LVAVEEHGGGWQYVRFRIQPKCAGIGLVVSVGLAFIAGAAFMSAAWAAAVVVAIGATLLIARISLEAGRALVLLKCAIADLIAAEGPSP